LTAQVVLNLRGWALVYLIVLIAMTLRH